MKELGLSTKTLKESDPKDALVKAIAKAPETKKRLPKELAKAKAWK